ncbi:hypothetical protein BJ684DRAFT_21992 [Piptocephalis cylindrospora]|uniref:Uncharacterized protein n=1 Tax=Piptocephalis cylindrospora TaxID=1907219 RepID=A0A4P9Y0X7_9FUNG|nr:hypothetical protein BJ684DRAFT_21992 [Piptocephalis cylindrospora]|eukprot:RKP11440.1 hypothetical protein BJ684DRAFT_21992 [Piptocephalis cylindrospora]
MGLIPEPEKLRRYPVAAAGFLFVSFLYNLTSTIGSWYVTPETFRGSNGDKPASVLVLCIISTVCSAIACITVLFRFYEIHVLVTTMITLVTSALQSIVMFAAMLLYATRYHFHTHPVYDYSGEFWMTILVVVAPWIAFVFMVLDWKTTEDFRYKGSGSTRFQRKFLLIAALNIIWISVGSLIYMWMEKWSFLVSLYYCLSKVKNAGFDGDSHFPTFPSTCRLGTQQRSK